jgi:putative mycofactocin binding protein MftB
MACAGCTSTRFLGRPFELAPQVSVRPESFGALLYHFGTRRLSFLKDPRLRDIVVGLGEAPTAHAACTSAGVGDAELARYERALRALADTDMIRERTP